MTNESQPTISFARLQLNRVALRFNLILHGVASAGFWCLFAICWTLLTSVGFGWVGWVAFASYVFFALPVLILQCILIGDLLAYVVIGQIFAFPALDKVGKEYAAKYPEVVTKTSAWTHLLLFLFDASPLSSLALWSLVVLDRMPEAVHGKLPARELKRKEILLERAVFATASAHFRLA